MTLEEKQPCQGCGTPTDAETTLCFSCSIEWAHVDANEEDWERDENPYYEDGDYENYEDSPAYNSFTYGYDAGFSGAWDEINSHRLIRWYLALYRAKIRLCSKIRYMLRPFNSDDIPF